MVSLFFISSPLGHSAPCEEGIAKLIELVGTRVDLTSVFGPRPDLALQPLVPASGGYAQDLLRRVRDALEVCLKPGAGSP